MANSSPIHVHERRVFIEDINTHTYTHRWEERFFAESREERPTMVELGPVASEVSRNVLYSYSLMLTNTLEVHFKEFFDQIVFIAEIEYNCGQMGRLYNRHFQAASAGG